MSFCGDCRNKSSNKLVGNKRIYVTKLSYGATLTESVD